MTKSLTKERKSLWELTSVPADKCPVSLVQPEHVLMFMESIPVCKCQQTIHSQKNNMTEHCKVWLQAKCNSRTPPLCWEKEDVTLVSLSRGTQEHDKMERGGRGKNDKAKSRDYTKSLVYT